MLKAENFHPKQTNGKFAFLFERKHKISSLIFVIDVLALTNFMMWLCGVGNFLKER